MRITGVFFTLLILLSSSASCFDASKHDAELADSLKIEANHNSNRLKSYKNELENNKVFANEREKSLVEFLEEQEKWELIRERGLQEYRKQKKLNTLTEGSTLRRQYLEEKNAAERQAEQRLKLFVETRNKHRTQQSQLITNLELEELELYIKRPRYEFAKRSRNKWLAGSGSKAGLGITSPGSSFQNNVSSVIDYPSQPDFPAVPAPYEGFDEIPPPPPIYYDESGGMPYDPAFGGDFSVPPPPPPDYDF